MPSRLLTLLWALTRGAYKRIYQIMGGSCEPKFRESDSSTLCPVTSCLQHFLFFVRVFKQTANLYMTEADKILFKPAKVSGYRSGKYGIDHYVSCISAGICLMDPMKENLHLALATLVCNRTLLSRETCLRDSYASTSASCP